MEPSHALALGLVVLAAAFDLQTRRIPNLLTFGAAAAGFVLHGWMNGLQGLAGSVAGWAIGVMLFLPLFLLRGMGAGDVKLLGAVGAGLGPVGVLYAGLYSVLAGGLLALVVGTIRGYTRQALANVGALILFWRTAGLRPACSCPV
jgi:prepilin peptidase CpaA